MQGFSDRLSVPVPVPLCVPERVPLLRARERCVCPAHHQLLRDRCPSCRGPLHFAFRLRDGRARVICGECERELAARSAGEEEEDGALVAALISLQDRIGVIVRGAPERRRRLEEALSTLWAPLTIRGRAAGLALWLDERGWRCPAEAQGAIGAPFPLGRLPIVLRIATLIAADAAFGLGDELLDHELDAAGFLSRRAAPLRGFPKTPRWRRLSLRRRGGRLSNIDDLRAKSYESRSGGPPSRCQSGGASAFCRA